MYRCCEHILWAQLVKKTKEYVHCECDLYTPPPPITTSHKRTEADIVCQPQLLWGRQSFCISPSSVRKRIWYCFPQTLTHSCSWVFFTHSTHPTHAFTHTKYPAFPQLACPSHFHPPSCIYPAHALFYPSLWSSKLPMLRIWRHLYIYSISTLLPPRQCYASFICEAGWPIFSVWPHAAIVHRCSALSCCSCTSPRQQLWVWQPGWIRMGTAGTDWLPFKAIYLGCLENHDFPA